MTADEIWQYAVDNEIAPLLGSTGRTPSATLGANLYTTVKKPDSQFVKLGARPAKFLLRTLLGTIPEKELEQQVASVPATAGSGRNYAERDLHPVLVWYADKYFGAHCRTVYHEKSAKRGLKHNQWIHPDIVAFSLTSQGWEESVVQLSHASGSSAARILSFELKISLDFTFLREYFFQAVSNSSWANEAYLVAAEIDDSPEFQDELKRLSQSFGIGVIRLDIENPNDTVVLLPARARTEVELETVNRVAADNPDFSEFISAVANSIKINQPSRPGFDKVLLDSELETYLKKLRA